MRKIKFNDGWVFHEGGAGALSSLAAAMGHGAQSREVTLPHDASIEMERKADEPSGSGNGFFQEKTVHYVKEFEMDAADAGSSVWLEFEGVYQNAYVYVNGAFAGKCPYGYGNFYLDVAKYLNFGGKNSVKVIVNNGVPSGRWYTGGGIYRDVNLMIANRLHLAPEGIHLATVEADGELAVVRAEFCVAYEGCDVRDIVLAVELLDAEGKTVASSSMPVTLTEQTRQSYRQKLYVDNPQLWDTDHPYLYTYRARILEQDQVLDEEEGTFGIRRLQLDPRHGLRINGKTVKLRGGCIHHDNGIIGAAEYAHAADRRIRKLKEAGFNAVRSSHYPMSRCLLEACDRQGMLVMEEFSDVWTSTKVDFDYGANMTDWWEHDVECMVNKDYNHPCVIMYSIGNEIPETGNKFDVQWGKRLADKIRSMDDSRYVTNSLNLMLSVMDKIGQIMAAHAMQQQAPGENAEINSAMNSLGNMKDIVVSSEIAGCDGRMKNRDYYTEFAKSLPQDCVILTAGCAKYRYNKLPFGDINGIPRVLDAGQCNDSYSLALIALKLKEVFGLNDINELPIAYNIAWYEQKAVIVLLALLSLGVKNIHLGPTLPAFLSPNVAKVLVDNFGISGINTVDEDLKRLGIL